MLPIDVVYQAPENCYLSTPLIAPSYPLDYFMYQITKKIRCPFGNDFNYVIVKAGYIAKVNVYGTYNEFNAYNLVKYYMPLNLSDAKIIFPEENFSEENYGFSKIFIPEDLSANFFD